MKHVSLPHSSKKWPWSLSLLLACCSLLSATPTLAKPEILSPPPSSTIYAREATTHMIIRQRANEGIKQTRVRKGDILFSPLRIKPLEGYYYLHFSLPLRTGKNQFEVLPVGEDITINYKPLRSLLNVNFNNGKVFLFHRQKLLPEECAKCHQDKKEQRCYGDGVALIEDG